MNLGFETVVWIIAALAFLPALAVMGGFAVAGVIAFAVLSAFYGGRYGLRIYEQQNMGKKAGRLDLNGAIGGKDGDDWGRD